MIEKYLGKRPPLEQPPYVPSWCYGAPGPKRCACGHHEGFHNDAGKCVNAWICDCPGYESDAGTKA